MILPAALGAVLLFSILAFAATEQWALSIAQGGIFSMAVFCAIKGTARFHPMALLPAGVACLGLVQLAAGATVYRFVTINAVVNWTAYAVLFVVALSVFADPAAARRFRRWMLYAGVAIAAVSMAQYFTSNGAIYWMIPVRAGRPFGPFVNPGHYAAFVELIIPLGIHEALRDHRRSWIFAGMAGLLYGSVIASASRGGVAVATLEILLLTLPAMLRRINVKTIAAVTACVAVGTAVAGVDAVWKRFQDKDPFQYRRDIVKSTGRMIALRPWTGFGLGAYEAAFPEFASFDIGRRIDHAHNDWAEWTAEGGIPMLLLTAGIVLLSARRAIKQEWAIGIQAVSLHALVDFPLQIPAIGFLVFTLLGALYADRGSAA